MEAHTTLFAEEDQSAQQGLAVALSLHGGNNSLEFL